MSYHLAASQEEWDKYMPSLHASLEVLHYCEFQTSFLRRVCTYECAWRQKRVLEPWSCSYSEPPDMVLGPAFCSSEECAQLRHL